MQNNFDWRRSQIWRRELLHTLRVRSRYVAVEPTLAHSSACFLATFLGETFPIYAHSGSEVTHANEFEGGHLGFARQNDLLLLCVNFLLQNLHNFDAIRRWGSLLGYEVMTVNWREISVKWRDISLTWRDMMWQDVSPWSQRNKNELWTACRVAEKPTKKAIKIWLRSESYHGRLKHRHVYWLHQWHDCPK